MFRVDAAADAAAAGRRPVVAVTGATGFIGKRLIPVLAAAGWQPRILVRSDPADLHWGGLQLELVPGSLSEPERLRQLVSGASAVVHLAGLIKAARREHYFAANRDGSRALAQAIRTHAPNAHTVLVSSLAAREPGLSDYAASKRAAEEAVTEVLGPALSILRPPAVYGPGDRETLVFFQLAALPKIPLIGHPAARTAVIHVDDLCQAIVALLRQAPTGAVHAVADARPEGYSWHDIMAAAAQAQALPADRRYFQVPIALLRSAALVGDVGCWFGRSNMLTTAKLRELRHLDWSLTPQERLPVSNWYPHYDLQSGFVDAVNSYRSAGWLKKPT